MVTSRFNVKFEPSFVGNVYNITSEKYHYYYSSNLSLNSREALLKALSSTEKGARFNVDNYHNLLGFGNLQIFKSSMMKMVHLWALKVSEGEFFESEASFVIPMLEMAGYNIQGTTNLYRLGKTRTISPNETKELQHLNSYEKWDQIHDNILKPLPFNPLTNLELRRGTLNSIPKIIHQVWFKDEEIPENIRKLQKTIQEVNSDFKYMLWTKENLTSHEFPMSHPHLVRTLEHEWATGKSYHPWLQALFSYEVLYNHGGIYLALNAEAKKPLTPFLKYELLFAGFYSPVGFYDAPLSLGREVMGCKKHSYHLRMVLTEIINAERMNY
jgi:hypothetical protein